MPELPVRVWAPLVDFPWSGGEVELSPSVRIVPLEGGPDVWELVEGLADDERRELSMCRHGLLYTGDLHGPIHPGELANLFLIALWIVVPTKTHIQVRFMLPVGPQSLISPARVRLLDRIGWIEGQARESVTDHDLESAGELFRSLLRVRNTEQRLWYAISLSFVGCTAHFWHASFVCQCAAMEAVLTWKKYRGLTKRLAKAYCTLVADSDSERDAAHRHFVALYDYRSQIIHGRLHEIALEERNQRLIEMHDAVRLVWNRILRSERTIAALEGPDSGRETFFKRLGDGYNSPKPA